MAAGALLLHILPHPHRPQLTDFDLGPMSRLPVASAAAAGWDSLPVAQHHSLHPRGGNGQLEGCVEVVLLLVRAMDHLPSSHHQKARVAQVRCVELVALTVQHHDARRAAACTRVEMLRGSVKNCISAYSNNRVGFSSQQNISPTESPQTRH